MAPQKEDLADFVRRVRKEKGLSTRDVANESNGRISYGYVSQIENRQVLGSGVSPARLVALARGLGVPDEEVFAIATGKPLAEVEALKGQLVSMFEQLPIERQEDIMLIVSSFHRAHSSGPGARKSKKET
jgi:transcriptional regulator with XRE-family HTH domain